VVCLLSADAVLVLRCQEDDCEAFDEIVARYKDGIYNYIWRMISNRDDAEDLAQEVFVKAYASIKKFKSESNLRTWLYKIASNLCIDKYRRSGLEKRIFTSMETDSDDGEGQVTREIPDTKCDPQLLYQTEETKQYVHAAIDKLPEKLKAAILLYDLEGMSYEEVSEALNCPIGTVKSRLFKARMQLRILLAPYANNNKF